MKNDGFGMWHNWDACILAGTYQYELIAGRIGIGSCEGFIDKWEKLVFGEKLEFLQYSIGSDGLLGVNPQGTAGAPLVKSSHNIRIMYIIMDCW